jgi:hypothetical protein
MSRSKIAKAQGQNILNKFISDPKNMQLIDNGWDESSSAYTEHYNLYSGRKMKRKELSFHNQVKLLAYLLLFMKDKTPGD